MTRDVLNILSLGAGGQSTTVALMSAYGELPKFDACIFADTGWEPAEVYAHLAKLTTELEAHDIPVLTVSAGNIYEDHINPQHEHLFIRNPRNHPENLGKQRSFIPFFIKTPTGGQAVSLGDEVAPDEPTAATTGEWTPGRTRRTCTKTYKIEPVEKKIRELLGLKPRQRWPLHHAVNQSFGISWDETERMSDPAHACIEHLYPLVDQKMDRDGCHAWMERHGWTAPRSACIGCPFHRDDEWRRLRDHAPDEWEQAVHFDEAFRERQRAGLLPMVGEPYVHDSRVPLREANIEEYRDGIYPLFGEDCSGFCGT